MDDSAVRDDEALALRGTGRSFGQIARIMGYERASHANDAFRRALKRRPEAEQHALRDQEVSRLNILAERIRSGPESESADAARQLQIIDRLRTTLIDDA